jgi:aryl-alcohol dehydrogenase-like predicted oxidoreductase
MDEFLSNGLVIDSRIRPFLRKEVLVSQLGIGTYRLHSSIQEHEDALRVALQSGVNLIDTSTNYTLGGAESLIGKVLQDLGGESVREQVVIVTKAGYIQGPQLNKIRSLSAGEKLYDDLVPYQDDCWHCIQPEFLEDQLKQSLSRLKVKALDVLLLHNPEYYLDFELSRGVLDPGEIQDQFYQRIETAFKWMEQKVEDGEILYYGISSNNLSLSKLSPEHVSLNLLLGAADRAAACHNPKLEQSHFQVIQFPLNPMEIQQSMEVLNLAQEAGLDVLTNRPLNAINQGRVFRLARRDYQEGCDYDTGVEKSIQVLESFEKEISSMTEDAGAIGYKLFKVGSELRDFLPEIHDSDFLHAIIEDYFLPHTRKSMHWLEQNAPLQTLESSEKYLCAWQDLEEFLNGRLNQEDFEKNLKPALGDSLEPLTVDSSTIAAGVMQFLMSFPSAPIVLNGMRCVEQVKSSTEALINENHPHFSALLKEFQERFPPTLSS